MEILADGDEVRVVADRRLEGAAEVRQVGEQHVGAHGREAVVGDLEMRLDSGSRRPASTSRW